MGCAEQLLEAIGAATPGVAAGTRRCHRRRCRRRRSRRSSPRLARAASDDESCTIATSPRNTAVGALVAAATPIAVAITPSMPLAPLVGQHPHVVAAGRTTRPPAPAWRTKRRGSPRPGGRRGSSPRGPARSGARRGPCRDGLRSDPPWTGRGNGALWSTSPDGQVAAADQHGVVRLRQDELLVEHRSGRRIGVAPAGGPWRAPAPVSAAASRRHSAEGIGRRRTATTCVGSTTAGRALTCTSVAPDAATHWPSTFDAGASPSRRTTVGTCAAANAAERSGASKRTTAGARPRTPERGSASTRPPRRIGEIGDRARRAGIRHRR